MQKRTLAILAVAFGILAVLGLAVGRLFLDWWPLFEPIPNDPTPGIVSMIEASGYTPEATIAVHGLALGQGVQYAYVAEATGNQRIIAANPPALEGQSVNDLNASLMKQRLEGESTVVKAPNGQEYVVGSAKTSPTLPSRVGAPAFIIGLLAATVAWLSLAFWIYLDAKSNGNGAALGWGLLGVLAAPLALAVWLISRRVQAPAQVCPGCGADAPKDVTFCVRCGHGLRPTCPDCRKPVEADWAYCGACGANLSE